jgi:hypothetical protein
MTDFIYRPENNSEPENSKVYVKFSNKIYCDEAFLKKHNIEYTKDDLEDTPLGKRYVIRK